MVLPFASDARPWSVLLLPKPAVGEVLELCVRVVQRRGQVLTLAVSKGDIPPAGLPAGYLFTGANGPHCPLGLFLGAVLPEGKRLLLRPQVQEITRPVVYVGQGGH